MSIVCPLSQHPISRNIWKGGTPGNESVLDELE